MQKDKLNLIKKMKSFEDDLQYAVQHINFSATEVDMLIILHYRIRSAALTIIDHETDAPDDEG